MRFHLWEVEVWPVAAFNQLFGIVKEVETKVKERARDGLAVDSEVLLLEMPASGSDIELV